jgi:hypothetical protein
VALACESDATTVAQHVLETAEERTAEVVEEMLIYLFFLGKRGTGNYSHMFAGTSCEIFIIYFSSNRQRAGGIHARHDMTWIYQHADEIIMS